MSYEPTIWKKGDKVTSTKLNKIENGIQGNDEEVTSIKRDLTSLSNGNIPFKVIDSSRISLSGVIVENASGWQRSDYIDISGYDTLHVNTQMASNYNCFYSSDKEFISWFPLVVGNNTITVPEGATYVIVCQNSSALNTLTIENISNIRIAANEEAIEKLQTDMSDGYAKLTSVNLFNEDTITPNSFINYTNGNVRASTVGVCASDFIPIDPGAQYVHSNGNGSQVNSCAFYTKEKAYISGIASTGVRAPYVFTTPENAYYMRWTIYNAVVDSTQIEKGSSPTAYSKYQMAVSMSELNTTAIANEINKVVTVGATGCDYTSILKALKSTPSNQKIFVTAGEYNIANEYTEEYGADYWTNYAGYATTDPFDRGLWVSNGRVVEMSEGAKLIFDLNGSATVKNQFSVFATGYNATIRGGTIDIGTNLCRYAIHDDWGSKTGVNTFEGIVFIGSPASQSHIGGGMGIDMRYEIKRCLFLNNTSACDISYHNNLSADALNRVFIDGCYGDKICAFRWYGNSTAKSHVLVSNCHFSNIYAEPHPTATPNTNINVELTEWNNVKTVA